MSDEKVLGSGQKKILDSSPYSGIAVPIAIVLVGALIIFGVTKMLSSGKDHRDLVEELNSKTFGNRWVAAYELSKFLAGSKIPVEDIPWVIENLISVYDSSVDARTRNFVVLALGSLRNPLALPLLNKALGDEDGHTKFNAVVALGNMPPGAEIDWLRLEKLLMESEDEGLQQAIIYAMASHQSPKAPELLRAFLQNQKRMLRYSAAIALIHYQSQENIPILEEIFALSYDSRSPDELNGAQVETLKLSILDQIEKAAAKDLAVMVDDVTQNDTNQKVSIRAKQVLKLLKN